MGSKEGANSPVRFVCPLRMPACQSVTKTENGSDLAMWAPPFFCLEWQKNMKSVRASLHGTKCRHAPKVRFMVRSTAS